MDTRGAIVGIDVEGTSNNTTALTHDGTFLVDGMLEVPSRHLVTSVADFVDPDAFFVGGGVVETAPWFRT